MYDLARLYINIIESAAKELEGGKGAATWGDEGYYFAENGVHYWQDVAGWLAEEASRQGCLNVANDSTLDSDEVEAFKWGGPALLNSGASCKSIRANKLFGWSCKEKELKDEIPEIVRSEAKLIVGAKGPA